MRRVRKRNLVTIGLALALGGCQAIEEKSKEWRRSAAETHFVEAVGIGDLVSVREGLVEDRTLVNAVRWDRSDESSNRAESALTMALKQGRREFAELLLAHDADPNLVDGAGLSPLGAVLQEPKDRLSYLTLLLEKGADPVRRYGHTTALHEAAGSPGPAMEDALRLLLSIASRVGERDAGGQTPLHSAARSANVPALRMLLARGADPNATFETPRYPGNPFPCLYGATGYNNNPALAAVLIAAGARVDDDESIYHSTEHPDLECLRLLLEPRPRIHEQVLKHMLDREDVTGAALLLDAGADPDGTNGRGETALHWAVWRDRSPAIVQLLLGRGASIEARRIDGRTAFAMAVLFGRDALAATLRAAGADTALSEIDRYLLACEAAARAPADGAGVRRPTLDPAPPAVTSADAYLLPDLADAGRGAAMLGLLAAGVGLEATGEHGATALHFACWRGHDALLAPLLARGADTTRRDRTFRATPPDWLIHGARFCDAPRGDYAAALRTLADAGATITADEPTGRAEVDAILRERRVLR